MSRHADRFTALLDACVLGGALRRNMLLSLAEAGLFRPRWSSRILDECHLALKCENAVDLKIFGTLS